MKAKDNLQISKKDIEKLLSEQTSVILEAVDEKINRLDEKFDKRITVLEIRINKKFDELITTLDKFLKRMTDMEDEFEMMKADINRMKKAMKEKLGVEL